MKRVFAFAVLAAAAGAQQPFDALTGENPEHFPKPIVVDIEHVRLEMEFAKLSDKSARVVETIIFSAPFADVAEAELNAEFLDIESVEFLEDRAFAMLKAPATEAFKSAGAATYFYDDHVLTLQFDPPLPKGARAAVRLSYTVHDPGNGLFWIEPLPNDPDPRWEVWSQGQATGNRHWFATHDYPNDRHTSEIIARVPLPNTASGNGRLVSRTENGDGSATCHWRMDQPHVSYLTSLVVGEFHIEREQWQDKPVEYYVPPRRAADAARSFRNTRGMLDFFSERFGEPYPYDRYAQLVVREYRYGGMENITVTTLTEDRMIGEAEEKHGLACGGNGDGLIAHELAHQWFGDLITCRTWSHIWLNEGWASYSEELWAEHHCGRDDYDYNIWKRRGRVGGADSVDSGKPLVYLRAPGPDHVFGFNGSAVYAKGGYLLSVLRRKLGDEAFFAGTAAYIDEHKYTSAITDDFRAALEKASGRDLEFFFRQWFHTPGTPQVSASLKYDAAAKEAVVSFEQTQTIDEKTPAFRGDFLIRAVSKKGTKAERRVEVTQRAHEFRIPMDAPPATFALDPNGEFLMGLTLDLPTEVAAETAMRGADVFARLDAIKCLGAAGSPRAVAALAAVANEEGAFWAFRKEAIGFLGTISGERAEAALAAMAEEAIAGKAAWADYRLREEVAEQLGKYREATVLQPLIAMIDDPSEAVAQAAARSLGRMYSPDAAEPLERAFARGGEECRLAADALNAMVRRADPGAMDAALSAAGPGFYYRSRRGVMDRIGDLLEGTEIPKEGNAATRRLLEVIEEPRDGVAQSAMEALGRLKWKGAIPALERIAAQSSKQREENLYAGDNRASRLAESARSAIAAINDKSGTRADIRALEERLGKLEEAAKGSDKKAERKRGGDGEAPQEKRRRFLGIF